MMRRRSPTHEVYMVVTLRLIVDERKRQAGQPRPSESELIEACRRRASDIRCVLVRGQRVNVAVEHVRRTSGGGACWTM